VPSIGKNLAVDPLRQSGMGALPLAQRGDKPADYVTDKNVTDQNDFRERGQTHGNALFSDHSNHDENTDLDQECGA
jgi:hypothetical protein